MKVEMGFFHGVTRKSFGDPTHGRVRCSGKIYWSWNKHKAGFSGAWRLIHQQVAELPPAVEGALSAPSPEECQGPASAGDLTLPQLARSVSELSPAQACPARLAGPRAQLRSSSGPRVGARLGPCCSGHTAAGSWPLEPSSCWERQVHKLGTNGQVPTT